MDGVRPALVRRGPVCSIYGLAINNCLWRLLPTALKTVTTTTMDGLKRKKILNHQVALEVFVMVSIIQMHQFADGSIWGIVRHSASL